MLRKKIWCFILDYKVALAVLLLSGLLCAVSLTFLVSARLPWISDEDAILAPVSLDGGDCSFEPDSGEIPLIYYLIEHSTGRINVMFLLPPTFLSTDHPTIKGIRLYKDRVVMIGDESAPIPYTARRLLISCLQSLDLQKVKTFDVYLRGWPFRCTVGYRIVYADGTKIRHNVDFSSQYELSEDAEPKGILFVPFLLNMFLWYVVCTPLLFGVGYVGLIVWSFFTHRIEDD